MKPLVCEMCGSKDLIKQDGVFVCQYCGCKYSVEEAKKMMVDGTVDVKGTVQIDNTESVEKYLQNARRAKEKEDWEEVEKYYNLVEQNDPNNIEAIFYSAYGKAKMSLIEKDIFKRQHAFNIFKNCISIVDDKYNIEKADEEKIIIKNMAEDINAIITSGYVFNEKIGQFGIVLSSDEQETLNIFLDVASEFQKTIRNIIAKDNKEYLHKILIDHYNVLLNCSYIIDNKIKEQFRIALDSQHKQLQKINSSHVVPEKNESKEKPDFIDYIIKFSIGIGIAMTIVVVFMMFLD